MPPRRGPRSLRTIADSVQTPGAHVRDGHLTTGTDDPRARRDDAMLRGFTLALQSGWRPRVKSERTIITYCAGVRALMTFLSDRGMPEVTEATREHIQEWMLHMRQAKSAIATTRIYFVAAQALFAWLRDEGERRDDPTERVSAPPLDRRLKPRYSVEQIRAIFATQDNRTLLGLRNTALLCVLLDTGLRREECARLRIEDVDWKRGIIRVMGKGSKERKVRIGPATRRAIDQYLRRRERRLPGLPWLWHSQLGGPLTGSGIASIHQVLKHELGFRVHPHRWRHTAIQEWLDSGMAREDARMLSGHESEQVFRVYTQETDLDRALESHKAHSPVDRLRRGR